MSATNRTRLLLISALLFASTSVFSEPIDLAREFLAGLKAENNTYNYNGYIHWKGEKGIFSEVTDNEARIDCSGFVGEILKKANSKSYDDVAARTNWRRYPKASNYYEAISQGWGFIARPTIYDVEAGDILAIRHEPNAFESGHVMFVDAKPVKQKEHDPIVEGTTQWTVTVIDSAPMPHGKNDTRYVDGTKNSGVGRGSYRFYVNAAGRVVGYVYNPEGKNLKSTDVHPIAFGKPF